MGAGKSPTDWFELLGATLDGKYEVSSLVAEGGFAVVYRARHVLLERAVALKVLKPPSGLSSEKQQRFYEAFLEEARSMARLAHADIVQVLDFGLSEMPAGGQHPWMAMEWLEGRTLKSELLPRRGKGGRSPREALALLRPLLEAMAAAHDARLVHRDLKPANVMLLASGRLKLFDFGIAKQMGEDEEAGTGETQTSAELQAYSLQYAAPEQLSQKRTGPWTDVHALGLLLTEVLTDRSPYPGEDRTERMANVLSAVRPTPALHGVDVGAWEPVLARAMARTVSERYRNAGELLSALEAALELPPPAAPTPAPSTPPSPPKTAPRVALALVLALGFLGASALLARAVRSAARREQPAPSPAALPPPAAPSPRAGPALQPASPAPAPPAPEPAVLPAPLPPVRPEAPAPALPATPRAAAPQRPAPVQPAAPRRAPRAPAPPPAAPTAPPTPPPPAPPPTGFDVSEATSTSVESPSRA